MDLIRAQYILIDLGFHCLIYAENVRYDLRKDYYQILALIFLRDELQLSNVAITPAKKEETMLSKNNSESEQ